jgi:CheY-like chemotaxis protein
VSRIVSGRLRLEVAPVDLAAVIRSAVDVVKPAADAKRIQIETAIDQHAATAIGDAQRLQQVIWNLLSNSVKFTPAGGHVRVALEKKNEGAELSVRDDGEGIRAEFLPHVFELFRQADAGPSRKQGGLGLGLAIVRRIVEMHGGTIQVESGGEGKGAAFIVSLPLEERNLRDGGSDARPVPANRSLDGSLARAPRLDGLKVLAVDDQSDTLEMIEAVLQRCGAQTRTSTTAAGAIALLKSWHPDVLVADIGLPEEDGYALIQRVRDLPREQGGQTPAVALTAYTRIEDRMRALSAGYHMHVSKPVEPLELVTILDGLRSPSHS